MIMAEVLKAVDYMHSQQLVHRDLKGLLKILPLAICTLQSRSFFNPVI